MASKGDIEGLGFKLEFIASIIVNRVNFPLHSLCKFLFINLTLYCNTAFYIPSTLASEPKTLIPDQFEWNAYIFRTIDSNFQGPIPFPPQDLLTKYNRIKSFFIALPEFQSNTEVVIESEIKNGQVYLPWIWVLDQNQTLIKHIQSNTEVIPMGINRKVISQKIRLDFEARYLVVTSLPSMLGGVIRYQNNYNPGIPIVGSGANIYYPQTSNASQNLITVSDQPNLTIYVPSESDSVIIPRQKNWYFRVGALFGGTRIASNPYGDPYEAGGGAHFSLGYSTLFPGLDSIMLQPSVGFRTQGGAGANRGMSVSLDLSKQFPNLNLGAGFYYDFASEVESPEGETTQFKDSLGVKLFSDWRMSSWINVGISIFDIKTETKTGQPIDGPNLEIYASFFL